VTGAVVMLIGFNLAPVTAATYWPQDQWTALLVPGGYFVLMTVPGDFEDLHVDFLGRRIVVTSWTEDDWVRRLGEAGLEVVRSGTSVHVPAEGMTEEHLTCLARRPGGTPAA
ncbi:hypothetical protein ACWDPI_04770, partial [Streptomyces zhihengii]